MRVVGPALATLHRVETLAAKAVASPLSVPVASAYMVASGMTIAKGIAVMSPAWASLGALAALLGSLVLAIGHRKVTRDAAITRQVSAARAASTSSIRAAKRESDAPRTAIERHEAARSSLYAMCHRFSTEHNGGRK